MAAAAPEPRRAKNQLIVDNIPNDDNSAVGMHENTMSLLDISAGDTVIVKGNKKKETVLLCTSDPACEEGKVRLNSCTRKNLAVTLGDVVGIHHLGNIPYGTKVFVLPFSDCIEGVIASNFDVWLKPYFSQAHRPVKVGDTFIARGNMRAMEFKVMGVEVPPASSSAGEAGVVAKGPADCCIVSPDTQIFCEGAPLDRTEEDDTGNIGYDDVGGCGIVLNSIIANKSPPSSNDDSASAARPSPCDSAPLGTLSIDSCPVPSFTCTATPLDTMPSCLLASLPLAPPSPQQGEEKENEEEDDVLSVPSFDFATQWVCERNAVWPKTVDYSNQCPKGHPLTASCFLSRGCHVCGDTTCSGGGIACKQGCTYGVCSSCEDALKQTRAVPVGGHASNDFPTLGVSPAFLRAMKDRWGLTYKGWTTEQTCQQLLKPLTSRSRDSVCSDLQARGSSDVGRATIFLSHTWSNLFSDTVDAVLAFVEGHGHNAWNDAFIWFDVFSTSQHISIDRPSSWWMSVFKSSIENMGQLVMVLQPWDNPVALTRAWCILELYSCASTGGRFHVALAPAERKRFLQQSSQPGKFNMMLSRVNSKEATCSRESDMVSRRVPRASDDVVEIVTNDAAQLQIMENVRTSIGFTAMDSMVFRTLEDWFMSQLKEEGAAASSDLERCDILFTQAKMLHGQSRYSEAETFAREAVDTATRVEGPIGFVITCKYQLARSLKYHSTPRKLAEAEGLYLECLEYYECTFGPTHRNTLDTMDALAGLLKKQGKLAEAEALYRQCLEGSKLTLGPTHKHTLDSMHNFARLLEQQGKVVEAEALFRECLEGTKRILGPTHRNTLDTMDALALLLGQQGKLAEAEALYRQCLESLKRTLGPMHMNSLDSMHKFARLLKKQGKRAEAETLFRECLEGTKLTLGPTHKHTLDAFYDLAGLLEQQGKLAEAEALYAEFLAGNPDEDGD